MSKTEKSIWLGFAVAWCAVFLLVLAAHATELPIPKQRGAVINLTMKREKGPAPKYVAQKPELCLQNGREPFPGQTLVADPSCPTKLRWRLRLE